MTKEQTEQLKLDNQLCFRLYTASRLIVQSYQPYLSDLGITYTQYLALMVLWEKSPVKVSEISSRLKLESNTVTPLVKRMEAQGLVKREKGKQDGRETIVSLTQKGKSLEKEAARISAAIKVNVENTVLTMPRRTPLIALTTRTTIAIQDTRLKPVRST